MRYHTFILNQEPTRIEELWGERQGVWYILAHRLKPNDPRWTRYQPPWEDKRVHPVTSSLSLARVERELTSTNRKTVRKLSREEAAMILFET